MSPLPATTGVPAESPVAPATSVRRPPITVVELTICGQFGALHTEGIEQFVRPLPGGGVTEEGPRRLGRVGGHLPAQPVVHEVLDHQQFGRPRIDIGPMTSQPRHLKPGPRGQWLVACQCGQRPGIRTSLEPFDLVRAPLVAPDG